MITKENKKLNIIILALTVLTVFIYGLISINKGDTFFLTEPTNKQTLSSVRAATSEVDLFYEGNVIDMQVSNSSSYFLTDLGQIYVFGNNSSGQLGLGNNNNSAYPVPIDGAYFDGKPVEINASNLHVLVRTDNGNIYSFGSNSKGQLGLNKTPTQLSSINVPTKIDFTFDGNPIKISAGEAGSFVLTDKGNLYGFGNSHEGVLGLTLNNTNYIVPTLVPTTNVDGKVIDVNLDYSASHIITDTGKIYGMGWNGGSNTIGVGNIGSVGVGTPTELDTAFMAGTPIKIASGYRHSAVLTDSGLVYVFGHNGMGQLGLGNTTHMATPTLVDGGNFDSRIVDISAGFMTTGFISENGTVYTVGEGADGQLGLGNNTNYSTIQKVTTPTDGTPTKIAMVNKHSLILTNQRHIYSFGISSNGNLGLGTDNSTKSIPTKLTTELTKILLNGTPVENGSKNEFNSTVTIDFLDTSGVKSATLNGQNITSGHEVLKGNDELLLLEVQDNYGNVITTEIYFDIEPPSMTVDTSDILHEINTPFTPPTCTVTDNSGEEITCNFDELDTSVLGEQFIDVTATDNAGNESKETIKVTIVDITAPEITVDTSDIIHEINTEFTPPISSCSVTDNSKETIDCVFSTIDTSKLGEQTLTVTATDSSGNETQKTIKVTIVDTTAPEITINTGDINHEVNATFTPPTCLVTDNSGEEINCEFSPIDVTDLGSQQTLTVTAKDSSGNKTTKTIKVTIVDTTAPEISIETADIKHEINTVFTPPTCDVTDNSGENIDCEFNTIDITKLGEQTLTVTAKDSSNNVNIKVIRVIIVDTIAPTINIDTSDIVHQINTPFVNPECSVTDNSGETITCTKKSINVGALGVQYLVVSAKDSSDNETIINIKVTVVDTIPPEIDINEADIVHEINTPFINPSCIVTDNSGEIINCQYSDIDITKLENQTLTITATDSSGNKTTKTINVIIKDTTNPTINIDTSDIYHEINTTFTPPFCEVTDNSGESIDCEFNTIDITKLGEQTLTVTATDSSDNTTTKTIKVIIEDTTAPEITIITDDIEHEINTTFTPPTCSVTDNSGESLECSFSAIDTTTVGQKTLWVSSKDSSNNETKIAIVVNVVDTTAPEIFVDDTPIDVEINGFIKIYPNCAVTDNSGLKVNCQYSDVDTSTLGKTKLVITAVDAQGNIAKKEIDVNVIDTKAPTINVDRSDIVVEINTTFTAPLCEVTDNSLEQISCVIGTVDISSTGTKVLTITAEDSSGNKETVDINVIVINTTNPPTITVDKSPIEVEINSDISSKLPVCNAVDIDGNSVDCVFGTVDLSSTGQKELIITATDTSGNTETVSITVTVVDTTAPEIEVDEADINHEINTQFINPFCTVTDNSKEIIECTFSTVDVTTLNTVVLTITAEDSSGNKTTKTINVIIEDTTPPILSGDNSDQFVEINGQQPTFNCTVEDNSGEVLQCVISQVDLSKLGLQVVEATATDSSGNKVSGFANVYVVDTTEPTITIDKDDIYHEVNTTFTNPSCLVTDNSLEKIQCEFSSIDTGELGQQSLTVTATDSSKNKTTVRVNVIIEDTTPPVITISENDITHEINTLFTNPTCSVKDNSEEVVDCEFSVIDVSKLGEQTLTVTATDSNNNETTKTIKVNIVDTQKPTINVNTDELVFEINTQFNTPNCSVVDNSVEDIKCEFSEINMGKLGKQILTVTATDASGNKTSQKIDVKIIDTHKPTIIIDNSDITQEINFAFINPRCRVSDNSGEIIFCNFSEVDVTKLGEQTVEITAIDSSENKAVKIIKVTVKDTIKPAINVDDTVINHVINTEFNNPSCVVTDNSKEIIKCEFDIIDVTILGEQILTITATDSSDNVETKTIVVNIIKQPAPTITVDKEDITHEINTEFNYPSCIATDYFGVEIQCNFSTISTDALGEQTLTITATDSEGTTTIVKIKVIVVDTTTPEITIDTKDITHEINTEFTNPSCTATDNSKENITCVFLGISIDTLGEQILTVIAVDSSKNQITKTIKVTIVDTVKPEISVDKTDIVHEINTPIIYPECTVVDNSGETMNCKFSEIDTSKQGEQSLTITAEDSSGNTETITIKVIIVGDDNNASSEFNIIPFIIVGAVVLTSVFALSIYIKVSHAKRKTK